MRIFILPVLSISWSPLKRRDERNQYGQSDRIFSVDFFEFFYKHLVLVRQLCVVAALVRCFLSHFEAFWDGLWPGSRLSRDVTCSLFFCRYKKSLQASDLQRAMTWEIYLSHFFWQCTEWCRPLVRNDLMNLSNMMSPHSCRGLEQALRVPRVMEDALVFCLQDLDPRGLIEPLEAGWTSKHGGSSALRRRTRRAFPWPGAAIALLQRFAQEICCRASYLAGKASRRCQWGWPQDG